MEEDTGKSLHVGGATGRIHGAEYSLVDYNRAGIPLIEIVTKPIERHRRAGARGRPRVRRPRCATCCARSASPTSGWSRARCAATPTCRCGRPPAGRRSAPAPRPRTSTRCAASSAPSGYEITRQAALLAAGGRVVQETRHWHEDTGVTTSGPAARRTPRTTATSPSPTWCRSRPTRPGSSELRATLPEPPAARRRRLQAGLGLHRPGDARRGQRRRARADRGHGRGRRVRRRPPASGGSASWPGAPTQSGVELAALPITPAQVAALPALVDAGTLNDTLARQVLEGVLAGEGAPERGRRRPRACALVSDDGALGAAVDAAIAANPDVAREDPRRQGRGGRRAGRRGDEGHARPGRRRPGPRAGAGPPDLTDDAAERSSAHVVWPI